MDPALKTLMERQWQEGRRGNAVLKARWLRPTEDEIAAFNRGRGQERMTLRRQTLKGYRK